MAVDLGDVIRLSWTNLSPAGAPVNATDVTVTITLPDDTIFTSPSITPNPTGVYEYDYQTNQEGRHAVHWVGTGSNPGAQSDVLDVFPASPPYLVSLASAKEQLNIDGSSDDEELRQVIAAVTGAVEHHLDMAVVKRTVVEHRNFGSPTPCLDPGVLQKFTLATKPVLSLVSVISEDGATSWDVSGMATSDSGVVNVLTGTVIWGPAVLTYKAGMRSIPANYLEAGEAIIEHVWQNQRGAAGAPMPGGLETPGLGFTGFAVAIPPAALELLGERVGGIA
jgi:hypothetical protein